MPASRALLNGWPLVAGQAGASTPVAPAQLSISGANGTAAVGDTASFTPTISGGTAPYSVAATGLPPGRAINNAATGLTTGAYTTAGSYSATYTVTDGVGATASFTRSVVVSAAVARTQNIASAMRGGGFSNGTTSNGTDTAFNSSKAFINESGAAVNAVQVVTSGWYTDTDANGAERNITGPITLTGAVEVGGVRVPLTWGGSQTGTLQPGANYVSDSVTLPSTLAAGGVGRIRLFGTCASGVKWPLSACVASGTNRDFAESGAAGTLTDKTQSGSPTTSVPGFFPTAILATGTGFNKVVLASTGDSISVGNGDGNYDASNNTGWNGRAATGKAPLQHWGVTGTTAAASAAAGMFSRRLDLFQKSGVTHLLLLYGTNDLVGSPAATVQSNVLNLANQAAAVGIKPVTNTLLPRQTTASADFWQTIGTQTVNASGNFTAGPGSVRAAYNAWVRSLPAPFFDYIETADALDANNANVPTRDGGYWLTGPSGTHLDGPYPGTVGSGATTTVIPTSVVKAANFFASFSKGYVRFTSGALAGTLAAISTSDAAGNITLVSALPSVPAQNDNIVLQSNRMSPTGDGTHPGVVDNAGAGFGGYFVLRDVAAPKIGAWNN